MFDVVRYNPSAVLMGALVAPLAIEGGFFAAKLFENRKEFFYGVINFFNLFSSNPLGDESASEAKARQIRHITKVCLCVLVVAAVAATSFNIAPPLLAAAATVLAVAIVIKTFNDPTWIKEKCTSLINWLKTAYVPGENETNLSYARRLARNLLITAVAAALLAAGCLALPYLLSGTLIVTNAATGWTYFNPTYLSEITSPALVYFIHLAIGVLGIDTSIDEFKKKNYLSALFYLCMGALACFTPFELQATHALRWHHLSFGLALAILSPFRAVQCFGTFMALDGALYFTNPNRTYDFSNIFVDNMIPFFSFYAISVGIQIITNALFPKKETKDMPSQSSLFPSQHCLGK